MPLLGRIAAGGPILAEQALRQPQRQPLAPPGSGSASSSPSNTITIGSRCCSSGSCWSRSRAAASTSRLNQSGRDDETGSTPSGAQQRSRTHRTVTINGFRQVNNLPDH
jgi:hypothetical protein